MATITGLTAERMLEIEGSSVVEGEIVDGHLILRTFSGTEIDAGPLPPGPVGPVGPSGGQIPGEIKLWPGDVLPVLALYGRWVWADGAVYDTPLYPKAAGHIAPAWRTFAGASDPGPNKFRVPDFRGLVPAGMDAMPAGARANRLTRAVSIVLAGKTGVELYPITVQEMPPHAHPYTDPGHAHSQYGYPGSQTSGGPGAAASDLLTSTGPAVTGITINNTGGGQGHETMQPTVFVPYIVKLDD
jgi:microcystin-dependent protein